MDSTNPSPKVSVIVPVYKAEKYLNRCVDSLLAQTFKDFEVLLIDDGSPDKSGEMCDEYARKDSRVRVFHKENGGVSSARQMGIDNARGEYTIHADPDDWVEPDMLEELYKKAKETGADMVICDYYVNIGNKQKYIKQQPSSLLHEDVLCQLFQQLHGSCCNKLVRLDCCRKYDVKFPLSLSKFEDLYVNASLLKNPMKVEYLGEAFYHYDQTANVSSLTRKTSRKNIDFLKFSRKIFLKLLEGTRAFQYAKDDFSFLIVRSAFAGHFFSSREFSELCKPYKKTACSRAKFPMNLFYGMACSGLYDIAYPLFRLCKFVTGREG